MKNKRKLRTQKLEDVVCQNLKKRRKFLELSQAAIANHLGISIQQVQKYETGTRHQPHIKRKIILHCEATENPYRQFFQVKSN